MVAQGSRRAEGAILTNEDFTAETRSRLAIQLAGGALKAQNDLIAAECERARMEHVVPDLTGTRLYARLTRLSLDKHDPIVFQERYDRERQRLIDSDEPARRSRGETL